MIIQSHTKTFLARVLAWPQPDEPFAYVNLHYTFEPSDQSTVRVKNGKRFLPWAGRACRSLDEAVQQVTYLSGSGTTRDIYFCTSTQRDAIEMTGRNGYKYYKATRSAENAVMMKSLFIDSDLKGGNHGYDTVEEYAAALADFLRKTGLPKPTIIVNSGGGFHMYWCLQRALTIEQWMPLAYALAEATKREGFKCDSGVTIDAARVLRVPGTRNHKYTPAANVRFATTPLDFDYTNDRIEKSLEPYKVQVPYTVLSSNFSILPPKQPIEGLSELAAGIDTSALQPVDLQTVVPECGFVAEALATGGANFANPLWNLTLLIATFTEGGRQDAHDMSKGHATYGPGETDEQYDRKLAEKLTKNLGWPKCSTIAATGCTACSVCPHLNEGKSPLNFGLKAGQQAAPAQIAGMGFSPQAQAQLPAAQTFTPGTSTADADLPPMYRRDPSGVILYPKAEEDGSTTWIPLIRYPMTNPWLQRDPWTLNFTSETEHGVTSQITVPCRDVESSELRKILQDQGFMVMGGQTGLRRISDFLMAWINQLQQKKDAVLQSVPFGWLVSGGKTKGFVYGGLLHTPTGEEVASNTDPELQRQFSPTGNIEPWFEAAKMITDQKRPALDALLATSFGAPLVRFTGHSGLLMSAYSPESGIGKSTAVRVAQAVWGDPVRGVQSLSDTQNSVLNKMGELRALPMYWDELQSDDDSKRFADTVFRLTLGKEKSRMRQNVTQRTSGTWQTMMIAASNGSLMDAIAYKVRSSTAGVYRVFEFVVEPPAAHGIGQIDPTMAQRILAKLNDNYGHVGYQYASWLGRHFEQVDKDVGTFMTNLGKEVKMRQDERFWVTLMGCTLLGARYANFLKFTEIDIDALKEFLIRQLNNMRAERNMQPVDIGNVVNVVNIVSRFLNENRARNTIFTDNVFKGRGRPAAGAVTLTGTTDRLEAIHVHYGTADKTLRIGQAYFYDWLARNNYPRQVLIRAMQHELGAVVQTGRLGAGTPYASASEYVIDIDVSRSPLMDMIGE